MPLRRCVLLYLAPLVIPALPLEAQSAAAGTTVDTAQLHAINPWPQRGWISAGVGVGTSPYHSLAAVAAGWYSVGPVAMGVRLAGADQWFGEQRSDQAFLVGARTRGTTAFLVGAIGTAKVASALTCDGPCTAPPPRPSGTEMAYTLEAHANPSTFFGIGGTMFGVFGPHSARYTAFAFTIDVGWFGS